MIRMLAPIALAACLSGCVTVYQPLHSLQRPTVVNTEEANFEGVRVKVRCPVGAFVKGGEAQKLCRKIERLFANQGALIDGASPALSAQGTEVAPPRPDLIIDIESRLLSDDTDRLFSVLCIVTATLVPWTTDTSLAEDITIRDADGFVLAADSFQARFVSYFGLAVWAVNGLIDLIIRPKDERITGDGQKAVVTRDFYSQLSQLAFHARTRSLVMRNFEPAK